MKKLKVGVIGAGGMARHHIKAYCDNPIVEVVALCDTNIKAAENRAKEYGISNIFDDYKKMLDSCDIDAVSIVTPNITHTEFSITALNKGKHVLLRKTARNEYR